VTVITAVLTMTFRKDVREWTVIWTKLPVRMFFSINTLTLLRTVLNLKLMVVKCACIVYMIYFVSNSEKERRNI